MKATFKPMRKFLKRFLARNPYLIPVAITTGTIGLFISGAVLIISGVAPGAGGIMIGTSIGVIIAIMTIK
jgi:hypothetical protein